MLNGNVESIMVQRKFDEASIGRAPKGLLRPQTCTSLIKPIKVFAIS